MARSCWLLALLLVATVGAAETSTPLIDAVKRGDQAGVRRLIQQKADVNAAEPDGTTPLHWAVRAGDRDMVSALLKAGARASSANRYGVTPIRLAAINGSVPLVDMLLEAGVSADSANAEGETALMTAARAGSVPVVKTLAAHGANVNARENWFGETAMMWAAAENHAEVVRLLASLGGDINARSTAVEPPELEFPKSGGPNMPFPRGGWTPLMYAAREGALDAARALVELGANLNAVALPQTDVKLADVRKLPDSVGTTALVYAIMNAHFDVAAMLIDKGANPNIVDTSGMAALYGAVEMSTLQWVQSRPAPIWRDTLTAADVVKRLLAKGADPNAKLTAAPIKISLDPGATLNFNRGTTPLMRAARTDDVEVMRLLLDGGADPSVTMATDGSTVLMLAAGQGLGAPRGDGPRIRVPTIEGAVEAVRLLLDRGAKVNATNNNGATALHVAVNRGDPLVKLLCERGADVNAKNKQGQTPLDLALGAGGFGGRRGGGGGPGGPGPQVRESTAALLRQFGAVASQK
jgi:ankyrin repeat protein